MTKKIQFLLGDLFSSKCDLIVLPCSRNGSVTGWVRNRIQQSGIPGPSGYKGLGATEFIILKQTDRIASYVCWATSVAHEKSSTEAIRQIGRSVAEYASIEPGIKVIAVPLLGTGAGGLDEKASARAIIDGFKSGPDTMATLRIHVLNPSVFEDLQREDFGAPPLQVDTVFISYGGPDEEFASGYQ